MCLPEKANKIIKSERDGDGISSEAEPNSMAYTDAKMEKQ